MTDRPKKGQLDAEGRNWRGETFHEWAARQPRDKWCRRCNRYVVRWHHHYDKERKKP